MPTFRLSNPEKLKMVTFRGNTILFTLNLVDANEDPIDLDGYTFSMTVYQGNYAKTLFTITGVNNVDDTQCTFTKAAQSWSDAVQAGCYNYRIDTTYADGTFTIVYGEFEVN